MNYLYSYYKFVIFAIVLVKVLDKIKLKTDFSINHKITYYSLLFVVILGGASIIVSKCDFENGKYIFKDRDLENVVDLEALREIAEIKREEYKLNHIYDTFLCSLQYNF